MNILVTGSNGFVGQALCKKLSASGYSVRGALRQPDAQARLDEFKYSDCATTDLSKPSEIKFSVVRDIGPETDWSVALEEIDVVVHLAAHVHITSKPTLKSLADVRRVNVAGTGKLARDAVKSGAKRFIYMSSVKVNGECTDKDKGFTENDFPQPQDPYSISKWEAEQALAEIAAETGLEIVILRAPLVYGQGVRANFLRLVELVSNGKPMPLASINNQRSLIYLGNLIDAISACVNHPKAAGKTFLVSDGEDISTPELINHIAVGLQRPSRLFPLPLPILHLLGKLSGKISAVSKLTGSLVIDSSKIRRELGWFPPYSFSEGLTETLEWYKTRAR